MKAWVSSETPSRLEVLWPSGWVRSEDDRGVKVLRSDGTVALRIGEQLTGAGAALGEPGCTGDGTFSLTDDLR